MMEEKREGRMGQKAEYIGRHVEKSRLISEKRFLGFKHTFENMFVREQAARISTDLHPEL